MKILSKITFLCNLSFIIFIVMQYVELHHKKSRPGESILPLPYITGILVILGQAAIFVNLGFCLVVLTRLLLKKTAPSPRWLVIANGIFLLLQIYYFFI